jgi:hypothetical protein
MIYVQIIIYLFFPRWLPRGDNTEVDYLSKCSDCDDWSILESIFQTLNDKWGQHTVDRFACHYNAKCRVFNSKYWCPGMSGVDAFKYNWFGENNWILPPPRLILKCIRKIKVEKCCCTVVVPCWKSAPYWPELFPGGNCALFVKDFVCFQPGILTKRGK